VLSEVKSIEASYDRRSDIGWLFSMVANESGTFAAVALKKRAQKWGRLRRDVEEQIRELKMELRLKGFDSREAERCP
jgi:hypothetical protein